MKVKHLSILAGGAAMMLAGAAAADHISAVVDEVASNPGQHTYQVSLTGFAAGDMLLAAWVASPGAGNTVTISTSDPGGFHFAEIGGNPFQPWQESGAALDATHTFLTVGGDTGFSPGFLTDLGTDGVVGIGESAVFSAPPLATMGADVMIGQFTVGEAHSITLEFGIAVNEAGIHQTFSLFIPGVPAPGVLALLGIAGLVGSSRRRR